MTKHVKATRQSPAFEQRSSGFLLHFTSLPGPHGSGDLGGASATLEFARKAGLRWWQVLPIHPPDGFASPYQSASSFAGHAGLIDLESLVRSGWLTRSVLKRAALPESDQCDFVESSKLRERLLRRAFAKFDTAPPKNFATFRRKQRHWLADWSLYQALTNERSGAAWQTWESPLRDRDLGALRSATRRLAQEIRFHAFVQFVFDENWKTLRRAAESSGVRLLGDLPMFIAANSADAWAHRELFSLESDGRIAQEAGTPPDAFSRHGQRWGVPTYRVQANARSRFSWWLARIRRELELFDALRLDHFIGYQRTFSVPTNDRSAGQYRAGLGRRLFDCLTRELGPLPLVVEDLGDAGPDVEALRARYGFPAMKILQYGLDGLDGSNPYLPHNWNPETIAYTGTHDNPTAVGWFRAHAVSESSRSRYGTTRIRMLNYTGGSSKTIHRDLIRVLWTSVARTTVAPVQDLLGLPAKARMNVPGRAGGNWDWRLSRDSLHDELARELREIGEMTGRVH